MTISLPRNPRRASSYVLAPDDVRVRVRVRRAFYSRDVKHRAYSAQRTLIASARNLALSSAFADHSRIPSMNGEHVHPAFVGTTTRGRYDE